MSRCGALVILEATPHYRYKGRLYAYGPYVREINLWLQLVNRPAIVVAPLANTEPSAIDLPYEALSVELKPLPRFSIVDVWQMVRTLALLPFVTAKILRAMRQAVHIHVRCPSNIGLLGLVLQVFFPRIPKTVKYAGNWHKYSGEPWSYRLQKLLARSPLWCRRTRVLVYGPDAGERAHVVSSFAASYTEADARSPLSIRVPSRNGEVRLLFVGALASHKRPIVAVEACGQLRKSGITARLDLLGDGPERERIEQYVAKYGLQGVVVCHGAVSSGVVTEHQRNAHFLLLLSESEGWPKAVSEAMFWGTVPVAAPVGCVPMMLGGGNRGALVEPTAGSVCSAILDYLDGRRDYRKAAEAAATWSRQYTREALVESFRQVLTSLCNETERASDC